jgi:hypothetical protein
MTPTAQIPTLLCHYQRQPDTYEYLGSDSPVFRRNVLSLRH